MKSYEEQLKMLSKVSDKHCVTYSNNPSDFQEQGFVSYVKSFDKVKDARAFKKKMIDDGTYIGYANLKSYPKAALKSWAELHSDSIIDNTVNIN
tara:strand:- start:72 stop:353 length:282 start_codon:yes stop_codon:yes gene_type:complete